WPSYRSVPCCGCSPTIRPRPTTSPRGAGCAARSTSARPARTATRCGGSAEVLPDLFGRGVVVRLGEALEELVGPDHVLLGADGLQYQRRDQRADLGAALQVQAPRAAGEEPGPEPVADPRRVVGVHLAGHRYPDRLDVPAGDRHPVLAQRGDPDADPVEYRGGGQAGLGLQRVLLGVVGALAGRAV